MKIHGYEKTIAFIKTFIGITFEQRFLYIFTGFQIVEAHKLRSVFFKKKNKNHEMSHIITIQIFLITAFTTQEINNNSNGFSKLF